MELGKCVTKYCRNARHPRYSKCSKCRSREYRKRYPGRKQFYNKKAHAKSKGIVFTLTREEFLEVWRPGLTINRVDGLKGYHRNNIEAIGLSANSRQGATTDKQRRYEPDPECGF
jgi:hypothetical protein